MWLSFFILQKIICSQEANSYLLEAIIFFNIKICFKIFLTELPSLKEYPFPLFIVNIFELIGKLILIMLLIVSFKKRDRYYL